MSARRREVGTQLTKMLLEHLRSIALPGITNDELDQRFDIGIQVTTNPLFYDVLEICEKAGLDLGICIRDASKNEVTFWPAENLSQQPTLAKKATRREDPPPKKTVEFRRPNR